MKVWFKILIGILIVSSPVFLYAQSSEQKVRTATNEINAMMEELHQLARQKDINGAISKLDEINAAYKKEIHWETFSKEYRNAKMSNPSFDYQLRTDLPKQLDPDFWKNFQQRCDRIMANQDEAVEGYTAMVQLNNYDKMMAYGAQIKTTYETFKNAAENLGSANLPKFAYDLYGNMNDFVENYKKIEQAEVDGIDIQTYKMDFNRMMSRARRSKDLYNLYQRFIQSNIIAINDFNAHVKYVQGLKDDASQGPLKPLGPTPEYVWNYEYYENEIKEVGDAMEHYEIKCSKLKADIEDIKSEARKEWSKVKGNIYSSDDEAQKQQYLTDCAETWAEFSNSANQLYEEAYQMYCLDNSSSSNNSDNSSNPFDGAAATGTTAKVDDSSEDSTGVPSGSGGFNPNNGAFVGTISAGGGLGEYAAIEVKYLRNYEKIVFVKKSGTLKHVQLIWRKEGGIWETAYQGKKTEFVIKNGIGKMPEGTTHLNFVVNANHNRWSANDVACTMDVYLTGCGNNSFSPGTETTTTTDNTKEDSNSNSSNNAGKTTYVGKAVKKGNTGEYVAINIADLEVNDQIRIQPLSGKLTDYYIHWLSKDGTWKTAGAAGNLDVHNKSQYDFRIDARYKNMPPSTTHMIVVVNSFRINWNPIYKDAEAKIYIVHGGGGSIADPSTLTPGLKPNIPGGNSKQDHSNKHESQPKPKKETTSNTVNKEFNDLIKKANESFNKPYWEEGQGPKASSNPKQESLNYLAKASRLINRESNVETKFSMVQQLVSTSARFAQRVHAYEAKVPFVNLAGQTAARASGQISSIKETETKSKKELQKMAYGKIAASWRAVRDATLVHGGTNYSKEYCDKEYVKYKELSER